MQQGFGAPQGQGMYPSGGGLPYGLAPSMPSSQPGAYGGAGYPAPQPYASQQAFGYPGAQQQFPPSTGNPGAQQQFPPSTGNFGYSNQGSGFPGKPTGLSGNIVELSVSCIKLKDADMMSKSDPVCVMFEKRSGRWEESGRTEMINNCHSPRWLKKFTLSYNPQATQEVKFEVYDWDSKSQALNRHDVLGRVETSLGTIFSSPGKQYTSSLKQGGGGRITILAEEVNRQAQERIRIQLMGYKLASKDTFGKSDPYYDLSKKMGNGQWSLVYKSEVIKNNANPKWSGMEKPITEICNGDYDRDLKIEVFDYDSSGENDLIGEFTTNLRSLSTATRNQTKYEVVNPKSQRNKRNYKNSGTLSVVSFQAQ
jgi:hypothetical protein